MKNICVIGASGKLGSHLITMPNTIVFPYRFEQLNKYKDWFEKNSHIDTVWHVARACRKQGTRRDEQTFLLEVRSMNELMNTRAKNCRFIYASSKTVYGISGKNCCLDNCSHRYTPYNVKQITKYFLDNKIGVYNCPNWQQTSEIKTKNLDGQRMTYALTKLANEDIIKNSCSDYKILRIWDIV